MPIVTVAICTYRRAALLAKCLNGLARQTAPRNDFAVLVVDNYGDEETQAVAARYGAAYVHEPTAGLSHARNRAAAETDTEWIFYLDDDAIPRPEMIKNFLVSIQSPDIEIIGGRFEHLLSAATPRWVRHYYRSGTRATPGRGTSLLDSGQHLTGCVMAMRTPLVRQHPFRGDLGMTALRPGYGEETEWQERVRAAGTAVYFSDTIVIDHLVGEHKFTVRARIQAAYAHGKARARMGTTDDSPATGYLREVLRVLFVTLPYDLVRVALKPRFYWQNGAVSTLGKLAFLRGKYGR